MTKFKPDKYQAECCGDIIWSKYEGQYVSCKCGTQFVDQTSHYTRATTGLKLIEPPTEKPSNEHSVLS